ncbi:hypothetical protein [Roseofilum casamattae]|uniref:Zinc ribbon domain-containing protein n=1 Tax=Roseofilum casamattae BLCC-M143 TaxID=3022442 RepID=A0ABT7BY67_9CYAN|nr:hypothetical protein [Roseofilum casamattae]MDJ1184142.1 zinc ribbon domain-containing protein [Roseofilum casamattae BLCC-M143]
MAHCPQCGSPVTLDAITCPRCNFVLKANGHPGIPLHRSQGEAYLCQSCTYHADDTCDYPQRPTATDCILYRDVAQPEETDASVYRRSGFNWQAWIRRNPIVLWLLGLVLASFLIALLR